jgi:hypothetical protein
MSAVVAVAAVLVPLTPHSRSSSSPSSSSCVLSRYSSSFSLASSSSSSSSYCVLLRSLPRVSRVCWQLPVTNSQQQVATSQDGHTVVVDEGGGGGGGDEEAYSVSRRRVLSRLGFGLAAALVALGLSSEQQQEEAFAVPLTQLAGRIPGLSAPDVNGLRTYRRPDAKSGGHGVGWSPMTPYTFKVPQDWEEVPVSIADLGGTEIDLRFSSPQEGNISVVVAPVLRFSSTLGDNATIEAIGTPEKVITAFGPEITGQNVEGKVKDTDVKTYGGRTYYQFELDGPHVLISATAAGNRLYLMSVSANGMQPFGLSS